MKILTRASAFISSCLFQITQMDIDYGGVSNTAWGNAADPQGYRFAGSDLHVLALPRRHEILLSEFPLGAGNETTLKKAAHRFYLDYLALFLPRFWHPVADHLSDHPKICNETKLVFPSFFRFIFQYLPNVFRRGVSPSRPKTLNCG